MSSGRSYTTTFKTKSETKGASEMQSALRDLQKTLSDTKREEKELSKEVAAAEKEIAKIHKQIAKTGEATEEQKKDLERLNKTVRDGKDAIEALKLKESQLQTQINETNKKIEDERKALEQLKASIADAKKYSAELVKEFGALGAAATAAVAGLFAFTKDAAQWADDLNTLSKQTGISTEELQKFAYAADIIDVSTETMTSSLTKLTRNMQSAAEGGTSAAAKAFNDLGISVTDASGQLRDRQEVFYEAIEALGRIENVTERDAVAMDIFGRSAQELNPLILGGAETLKQLGDEAERAGLILDQTTLNGLNEFNDKIDLLKAKGTQIKNLAASEMTPALDGLVEVADELLDEIKEMAKSGELKKMAREAGKIIKDGATALKNIISFVWKYKEAIGAAITAMVTFKVALTIANLVQSLGNALKVLKGATDAATLAQHGLNTALAANPIGAVCAAVSALTMGTIALVGALSNQDQAIKNTTVEVEDYTEALRSTIAQEKKVMSAAEGEAGLLRTQQEEYDTLRQKTNLTAEEKRRLDDIASKLATTLGTTTEALKDQSGAYRDVSASVDEYIRSLKYKAKAEHLESIIKESTAAMFDLEEPIENAKSKIAEIEGKIAEFAEETKKHDAEWNKAHESEREQLKKTYKEAQQTYAQLETQRRDALLAQQKAEEEMRDLGKTADKTTASSVSLGQALSAVGRTDTILRQAKTAVDELGSSQEAAAERVSELEDELKQANSELETQRSSSRSLTKEIKEYEKELEAATKAAEEGYGSLEDLYLAQERLNKAINDKAETAVIITQIQERIKGLKKELQDASDKARTLDDVLSDLQKTSSSLRSEMASLAGSYQQLQNGQSLSLDTLMGLIEKYPEYSEMLIAAAGNVDLQKQALETLFEAKKNDYVITQEKALATIEASNAETEVVIENTRKQVIALSALANVGGVIGAAAAAGAQQAGQQLLALTADFGVGIARAEELKRKISFVSSFTPSNFVSKPASNSGSSGSSGSSESSGSTNALWEMNSQGVYASGDTYLKAYEAWIGRMKNLKKMSTEWEIEILEGLLKRDANTADERYEIEYALLQAKERLQKDNDVKEESRQKELQEREKKRQEALLDRQKLAQAAFNKLVDDRIKALEAESDAAQKAADAEIKAIDEVEARRRRSMDDDKRRKELQGINARLTYSHDLTDTERYDLERRKQEILNEQYEINRERGVELRRSAIQSRGEAVRDRNAQAIEGLRESKSGIADRVAYLSGSQTYDQRVANNSKTVNIQLITSGLTEDQAAKRIVQKVLKELG